MNTVHVDRKRIEIGAPIVVTRANGKVTHADQVVIHGPSRIIHSRDVGPGGSKVWIEVADGVEITSTRTSR